MPPTRAPPNYSDFVCVDDFEQFALKVLPVNAKDYYKSGACAQETLRNNKEAFRRSVITWIIYDRQRFPICGRRTTSSTRTHRDLKTPYL
jgi:hypothetical protein